MTRTLFDLSDELLALEALLEEAGGELTPELDAAYEALLGDKGSLVVKIDGYAALIAELAFRAEARKAEAKRLADLARVDENKAKALKERLKVFFDRHGLRDLQTERHRFTVVQNGGARALVLPDGVDVSALPERYATPRTVYELDKDALRADLAVFEDLTQDDEDGERYAEMCAEAGLPGGVYLAKRGTTLRIK